MKAFLIVLLSAPLFAASQHDKTKVYTNDIYHEYTIGGQHAIIPGKSNAVNMYCGNLQVKMNEGPVKLRISCGNKVGNTSPLFVVNDCIIKDLNLTGINPADIKSISVLKDARAIEKYGQQAKNGVIQITLKENVPVPVITTSLIPIPKP